MTTNHDLDDEKVIKKAANSQQDDNVESICTASTRTDCKCEKCKLTPHVENLNKVSNEATNQSLTPQEIIQSIPNPKTPVSNATVFTETPIPPNNPTDGQITDDQATTDALKQVKFKTDVASDSSEVVNKILKFVTKLLGHLDTLAQHDVAIVSEVCRGLTILIYPLKWILTCYVQKKWVKPDNDEIVLLILGLISWSVILANILISAALTSAALSFTTAIVAATISFKKLSMFIKKHFVNRLKFRLLNEIKALQLQLKQSALSNQVKLDIQIKLFLKIDEYRLVQEFPFDVFDADEQLKGLEKQKYESLNNVAYIYKSITTMLIAVTVTAAVLSLMGALVVGGGPLVFAGFVMGVTAAGISFGLGLPYLGFKWWRKSHPLESKNSEEALVTAEKGQSHAGITQQLQAKSKQTPVIFLYPKDGVDVKKESISNTPVTEASTTKNVEDAKESASNTPAIETPKAKKVKKLYTPLLFQREDEKAESQERPSLKKFG